MDRDTANIGLTNGENVDSSETVSMDIAENTLPPVTAKGTKRTVNTSPHESIPVPKQPRLITSEEREMIIDLEVPWPICEFHESSKRSNVTSCMRKLTLTDLHVMLDGWNNYPEIAIDGMTGLGKSTILTNMNRGYQKVNMIVPEITKGSSYNYCSAKTAAYLFVSQLSRGENICWDRCRYSNLIFYLVHALMAKYKTRTMPLMTEEIYDFLGILAVKFNLLEVFEFCESDKTVPTIVLVSSNFAIPSALLIKRGSASDIFNAASQNYLAAQYNVYCFIAKILNFVLIDINDFVDENFSLTELYTFIKQKIDVPVGSIVKFYTVETDDIAKHLNEFAQNQTLLFSRSCK